ncbi:MAG: DNA topoisomerase 3 [Lachnospiraceae bacterium]|nr:DNA topoisomerase 3 [Lachnospiraceae bacterium]
MYKLVIAEKTSVAQSIAKVIGAMNRKDGYLEGNGYLVSWCVGHLVELAGPESYDEKYEKWRYEDLPIFPDVWKYQTADATKKQFKILKELMERDDVSSLIESTDAGREGELIFRLVYHQCECRKPFERLWISSMEDKAIVEGFANLKLGTEYDALYQAALCRERADWIVGMNATRLFSTLYGQTLNVGRVMTPTLAMLVTREAEIDGFKSEAFYSVEINVGGITATSERFQKKSDAESILKAVKNRGNVTVAKNATTEKKEKAPQLYDLTSLQRDANRILGFTAQQTLDYAQSLYEKKLVTYPRTDSRFLTDEMEDGIANLAIQLGNKYGFTKLLMINTAQVINSKKVSDHHAIIPTLNVADAVFSEIPAGEQKVLGLITARLLAGIGDPCINQETELEFICADTTFKAKAKQNICKGWKEIERWILGKKSEEDAEDGGENHNQDYLSAGVFEKGKSLPVQEPGLKEGKTSSKKHFTEDTLLSAMEHASTEEMPEEAQHQGIGTPATRAATIEKLVRIGFVERKGDKKTKYLLPTHKGVALITVMPEQIQSPIMTADWEKKLIGIEHKQYEADAFMDRIEEMIATLVSTYQVIEGAEVLMHPAVEPIGMCPCCGKNVIERQKGFFCEDRECKFALWKDNRFIDSLSKKMNKSVAENLLKDGKVKLRKCRSLKTGKTYDTTLVMKVDQNQKPQFSLDFENRSQGKDR